MDEYCLIINYNSPYGWIKTYYYINLEALEVFEQWYLELDCLLLDTGIELSKENLKYKIITQDSNDDFILLKDFINTFGTPWELLEQIDDLEKMFETNYPNSSSNPNLDSDTDSDLYTETETIGQIISAHINGDASKVKELLNSSNASNLDDEVISNIKKKYI